MRFGFVTCVELGLACMQTIHAVGGRLDLAITLPDTAAPRKSGRVFIDPFCVRERVNLLKVGHINDLEVVSAIREHEIDWLFIVGWSQIAGRRVLEAPRCGVLGMHPTLLPEGRGRAAIPWAILKGLRQTGVTLFRLDEGVDTGPILAQEVIPLSAQETATDLYRRVADAHKSLIARVWGDLADDRLVAVPQDEAKASTWPGRTPEDGRFDANCSVGDVERLVRAVTRPYPGAFIDLSGGRLRVWAATPTQSTATHEAVPLQLSDGMLWATDFKWEEPGD